MLDHLLHAPQTLLDLDANAGIDKHLLDANQRLGVLGLVRGGLGMIYPSRR
jgi:hypothetical protein